MADKETIQPDRVTQLEVRVAVLESNQKEVDKKLDKIDANISKLTWIVVAAVIGAVLKSVGLI